MERHVKVGVKALALAYFVLPVASAVAFDGNTAAEARVKIASRGLEVEKAISGLPLLISRADVEAPLTRVRQVEFDDSVDSKALPVDPAFKAVLLTPRESTGQPLQPSLADLTIIDSEEKPEKAPEKQKNNPTTPAATFPLQIAPHPAAKDYPNDKGRSHEEHKTKQLATIPEFRSTASTPPQSAHGLGTAASPALRTPAEIAGVRALTRF